MNEGRIDAFAEKFGGIHTDAGRKASLLRIICIVFLVIVPIGFTMDLLRKSPSAWTEGPTIPLLAIALALLYKGQYKRAAYVETITINLFAIAMCMIIDNPNVSLLYANIGYYMIALSVMILFIDSASVVLAWGIAFAVAQVVFALFVLMPRGLSAAAVLPDMFGSILVYLMGSFFLYMQARLSLQFRADLNAEREKLQLQMDKMTKVLTGSTATFNSLQQITSQADSIRSLISDSGSSIESINRKVDDIGRGADDSLAATNTIGVQITELNKHIQNESAAREESSASINQMVSSVKTVADSAQREKEIMQTLSATSSDGAKQLEVLLGNIGDIAGSIDEIQNMVTVITGIANQTNLLSMNAAIEAAHAGASGRGFAVVAEEIRKLADTSAKNAHDIKAQLKAVIGRIQNASANSQETRSSFNQIQEEIAKSNTSFDEIANATSELSLGGQEILTAITSLGEMSSGIKDGGRQIGEAQSALETTANNLKTSLAQLSQEASSVVDKNRQVLLAVDPIERIAKEGAEHAVQLQAVLK
jgi:methyl-accepting chemotaxis protein